MGSVGTHDALRRHFREALAADPTSSYRDWFRAQAELREGGDGTTARALADDFWEILPSLPLVEAEARARFHHNAGVFFGSPGPAADLERARSCFGEAISYFAAAPETGWHARALHNFATAISNLGSTTAELSEAISLFEEALAWRTSEREIARGVSLHNLGLALGRLADLDPDHAGAHLEASASALREAVAIRARHDLAEGRAQSLRHLQITLERLGQSVR